MEGGPGKALAGRQAGRLVQDWLSLREGFTTEWLSRPQSSAVAALFPPKYLVLGWFPEEHCTAQ